ncbi:response regulator [Candidatus Sumerlaeota bacterium]|nr:response regulator [Candidatus Sumerlaeota bacterium]
MPHKILLADDEEDIKVVVRIFLEGKGHEVVLAFDGLDAIDMARQEKPDLIFLDVMMPVINGYEVCEKLKADPATKDIPIVMLSAASHADSIKKGLDAGAADYIVKPFDPVKLEAVIDKILGANPE